jgi:puromycin-sensitive aminopeptidase
LLGRTLARTINGEMRTQDAPSIVGAVLGNVYGRELAWDFVKTNWDQMDRLFPKQGLRRMCGGIVNLATPEGERDVRTFFVSRKIDLGGKTLEQYLEQLRIAVTVRQRERQHLRSYLMTATGQKQEAGS